MWFQEQRDSLSSFPRKQGADPQKHIPSRCENGFEITVQFHGCSIIFISEESRWKHVSVSEVGNKWPLNLFDTLGLVPISPASGLPAPL